MTKKRKSLILTVSVIFVIVLWYLASFVIDASVILPKPHEVLFDLLKLVISPAFFKSIIATVLRALESFIVIVISGAVLGLVAGIFPYAEVFLKPFVSIFKATPVMSIVLIAFFWFSSNKVPVFSAFLMAFPVMYIQTLQGYKQLDKKLEQMCEIYGITGFRKLKYFTLPSLVPYFVTGAKQSLSMIWKVVIAAEVLTVPDNGIGRGLQLAQMNLQTARVFAWTLIAIVLTSLCDWFFSVALKSMERRFSHVD